jgi:hypothetical protein
MRELLSIDLARFLLLGSEPVAATILRLASLRPALLVLFSPDLLSF